MSEAHFTSKAAFSRIVEAQIAERGGTAYIEASHASNLVALVPDAPEPFVVKVATAHTLDSMLDYEASTLTLLATTTGCPFKLPRLLEQHLDLDDPLPPHIVLDYLPGEVLTSPHELTDQQRYAFGRDVGRFGLWLRDAFPPEVLASLEANDTENLEDPKRPYIYGNVAAFLEKVADFRNDAYPTLCDFLHWSRNVLSLHPPEPRDSLNLHPVHGDLRLANAVLGPDRQLTAVIDHTYFLKSDMGQYARGVHPVGKAAMRGLNDTLEARGMPAITDDLGAVYSGIFLAIKVARFLSGQFEAARPQIPTWAKIIADSYPDRDWSEFERLTDIESF